MKTKQIIPCIYLFSGQAVAGFQEKNVFECKDVKELTSFYCDHGADAILVFDLSGDEEAHAEAIHNIRDICDKAEVPVYAAGHISSSDDVKKLFYAGCQRAILNFSKQENIDLLEEASKRFGKNRISVCVASYDEFARNQKRIESYTDYVVCLRDGISERIRSISEIDLLVVSSAENEEQITELLKRESTNAVSGVWVSALDNQLTDVKYALKQKGIPMQVLESTISWSDFKKNSDNMVPVIVQDWQNDEVLMLGYMNELAFETTLRTGKMTYWSRSRNELWTKGLTSGHLQYVKSLSIDCDNDTILAKVSQVGAACHTGNRSCFYRDLVKKEASKAADPLHIFEEIYAVILDRKNHPKDGSYTNHLFDKGIDKILNKIGEEAAAMIIAAKNPNSEDLQYEISDFLYHLMVLMADKEISWKDIVAELSRRS